VNNTQCKATYLGAFCSALKWRRKPASINLAVFLRLGALELDGNIPDHFVMILPAQALFPRMSISRMFALAALALMGACSSSQSDGSSHEGHAFDLTVLHINDHHSHLD